MKKIFEISFLLVAIVGIILMTGGIWGITFTYKNIAQEKIVTPADALIPEKPVRGPLTLKAQADVIRKHALKMTDNRTFAEMPRQVAKFDETGQPILNVEGKPVMVANTDRDIWITATTLTTALNIGILAYAFSGLIMLFGCILIWIAIVFYTLSKR